MRENGKTLVDNEPRYTDLKAGTVMGRHASREAGRQAGRMAVRPRGLVAVHAALTVCFELRF